jgi:hypothetical protein
MSIIEIPARKSNDWTTPAELRTLLKANLGLHAKQVSVKQGHSLCYLTITIRAASVNVAAVEQFAKTFNTWSMDMTDYVTGQSVDVVLSDEVREALAAPFIPVIESATLPDDRQGTEIVPGVMLWNVDRNCYLSSRTSSDRSQNVWTQDLAMKSPCTVRRLALSLALMINQ